MLAGPLEPKCALQHTDKGLGTGGLDLWPAERGEALGASWFGDRIEMNLLHHRIGRHEAAQRRDDWPDPLRVV